MLFSILFFVEIGRPAVFAFFMLSGYWVLRMYEQTYRSSVPVWIFFLSRFMRIWLAFAAAFVIFFLLFAVFSEPKPVAMLGGLPLLGIATTKRDVLGTSWSLDIELQFYLLVPVLSLVLAWAARAPDRAAFVVLATALLTMTGWYLQITQGLWSVLSYLPPFMTGAFIWHLRARPSGRQAGLSVLVFIAVGTAVALTPYLRPLLLRDVAGPFNEDWFGMVWMALLTPFMIWNVQQKSGPLDRHLGNYSYALYITHWPVIALLRPVMQPLSLTDRGLVLLAILVVSMIFYVTIDRGAQSLRRRTIAGLTRSRIRRWPA